MKELLVCGSEKYPADVVNYKAECTMGRLGRSLKGGCKGQGLDPGVPGCCFKELKESDMVRFGY